MIILRRFIRDAFDFRTKRMLLMRKALLAFILFAFQSSTVFAQSNPGWPFGFVPTAAQWNAEFAAKVDVFGGSSCSTLGCTFSGELVTAASSTTSSGLNIPPGVAPTSPVNGDVWTTALGMYARINGTTIGPFSTQAFNTPTYQIFSAPGAVTTLTLTTSPLPTSALFMTINFDGVTQSRNTWSVNTGTGVVTFNSAIPINVQAVEIDWWSPTLATVGGITYGSTSAGPGIGIPYNTSNGGYLSSVGVVSGGLLYGASSTVPAFSSSLAQYGVLFGGGIGASPTSGTAGTSGQLLIGQSAANAAFETASGDVASVSAGGAFIFSSSNTHITSLPNLTSPLATTSNFGLVKCDGTTTTCVSGVISAAGGGGSASPANLKTTYGAVGNGVTNDTSAFNSAMAAGGVTFVPCGTYYVSSTITALSSGTALIGAGRGCVIIMMHTAGIDVFNFGGSLFNTQISHMTIDSAVTGTVGQIGIDYYPTTSQAYITDVIVQHQYEGMRLSNTDFSTIENSYIQLNQSNGILMVNSSTGGALQWQVEDVLSQGNGGIGLEVFCTGTGSVSVGQVNGYATYANSSYGYAAQGSASCPISGIRMINSFLGNDGNSEIYLQTYGSYQHVFTAVSLELAGNAATGPTLSTPASHVGAGFQISAVDYAVSIINSSINGCSQQGILINGATAVKIIGGYITNNSQPPNSGLYPGIGTAGPTIVQGVGITGATQSYGVLLANSGANYSNISNNDLRGNGTGEILNSSGIGAGATLIISPNF